MWRRLSMPNPVYPIANGPALGTGLAQFNSSYSNPSALDAGCMHSRPVPYEGDESYVHAQRAGAWSCITKDRLNQDLASLVRDCARRVG
jgi:hypothetical protein